MLIAIRKQTEKNRNIKNVFTILTQRGFVTPVNKGQIFFEKNFGVLKLSETATKYL